MNYNKHSKRKTDTKPAPKSAHERFVVMQVMGDKPFFNSIESQRIHVMIDTEKNIVYSKFGVYKNMSFPVFLEYLFKFTNYSNKCNEVNTKTSLYKCVLKMYGITL